MLASLCLLLSGACLPPCPAMEGAGMVHGCGLGEGWHCSSSSSAIPGPGAGQEAAEQGRTEGSLGCWGILVGLHPLYLRTQHTGSPACPDITLGAPRGSPGWGFRDQIPCFQPHFQPLEGSQTGLGKKRPSHVVFWGSERGTVWRGWVRHLHVLETETQVLCLRGTKLIWPVLGSCNK